MKKRILIIDGHPDSGEERYVHALARAYRQGAESAGHEVRTIVVGALDFPMLRTSEEFRSQAPPAVIHECQQNLAWADHWLILYPLWLGSMPAALKAFFEQALRPGFAFAAATTKGRLPRKLLRGKSARHRRDHGHARVLLSLVLSCPQPEEPGAQRARVLWHRAGAHQHHRYGGRAQRRETCWLAEAHAGARPRRALSIISRVDQDGRALQVSAPQALERLVRGAEWQKFDVQT